NGTVPRRPSGRVGAAPTTETAAQPMHYFITRCEVDSGDAHWRKGESREDRKVGLRNHDWRRSRCIRIRMGLCTDCSPASPVRALPRIIRRAAEQAALATTY